MLKSSNRKHNAVAHCSIFIKISMGFFICFNFVIFYNIYEDNLVKLNNTPECLRLGTCKINTKPRSLPRDKWGQTVFFNVLFDYFMRDGNEWRLLPSKDLQHVKTSKELNCSSLKKLDKVRFIGSGYTKSTYKVKINNQTLSLKTINVDGHDMNSCLAEEDRYLFDCFLVVATKLLKEIAILHSINHDNVGKILGYCVPADPDVSDPRNTVAIFQEYGEPVDVIKLLQLSWEDRLRLSLGLSRLLKHLSSFVEPIALNDFRRQQFIVADGELKLIDVDDIGLQEQRCDQGSCCSDSVVGNTSVCVPCVNKICHGYNEKINILRSGRHFIKHILPYGVPVQLNAAAARITDAFQLATLDTHNIWREMEDLTKMFRTGMYRNGSAANYLRGYKAYTFKDVPSKYDFRCQLNKSSSGCVASVLDAEEAAEICWTEPKCKAFVLTEDTTWTGRRIVHFKSGFENLLSSNGTTVFIKL